MTSVGLSLFKYQDDARSNKHKIVIFWNIVLVVSEEDKEALKTLLLLNKAVLNFGTILELFRIIKDTVHRL